jgi:hypothetical protein
VSWAIIPPGLGFVNGPASRCQRSTSVKGDHRRVSRRGRG